MPSLFSPQHLQNLCRKYGLKPSRNYGQNFLINEEVIDDIILTANVRDKDVVVEVGPGWGALTLALSGRVNRVVAYEIEKKLLPYWEELQETHKNIEVVWGNVLRADMPSENYKVVANLPYQITSQVIRRFLEDNNPPRSLTLMVQKEVAERICALPGDMSLLALSVQYYATAQIVRVVPRTDFWPAPQVDSAIINIVLSTKRPDAIPRDRFFALARAGFAAKRKLLIKNLGACADKGQLEEAFAKLGWEKTTRAQELSVEQWVLLAQELAR